MPLCINFSFIYKKISKWSFKTDRFLFWNLGSSFSAIEFGIANCRPNSLHVYSALAKVCFAFIEKINFPVFSRSPSIHLIKVFNRLIFLTTKTKKWIKWKPAEIVYQTYLTYVHFVCYEIQSKRRRVFQNLFAATNTMLIRVTKIRSHILYRL